MTMVNLNEEKEKRLTDLKLITGGKEPPSTTGDWLSNLEEGTVFFVQSKTNPMDFNLGLFRIMKREGKVIVLQSPMLPKEIYVNPVRFCNNYLLYENMGVIIDLTKEEEHGENHDDDHRVEGDGREPTGKME